MGKEGRRRGSGGGGEMRGVHRRSGWGGGRGEVKRQKEEKGLTRKKGRGGRRCRPQLYM